MNEALGELGHPPSEVTVETGVRVLCQTIPEGLSYAVCWNPTGPDHFLASETAATAADAKKAALAAWREAAEAGLDRLHQEHVAAWERFWQRSAVALPEDRMEFLWYFGLYLLASAARRGQLPPGLQGVWAMDGVLPPWRGEYATNVNVQETFWPALASGHLDLMDCWCDFMRECLPYAQDFARRFFGSEGAFFPTSFAPRVVPIWGWYTVNYCWSSCGWLAGMHWQRWRYSMDRDWLAHTGYPVVAQIFRFYRANLQPGDDGRLHVPLSTSPEYGCNTPSAWAPDPNIDLALIRRCCDWVVAMEGALGIADLTTAARNVRAGLAPYALTEDKVLCLWAGKTLDTSYHHPSQLMAIHPAMDLTIEGDAEARRIIEASLLQYLSLGQYLWAGHTYAQMSSLAAVVGQPEFAYDCLLHFAEYWIGPNGLHFNRDLRRTGVTRFCGDDIAFTMEANCGITAGMCDMLLQGWNDTVRVFPAVPAHWRDVAFRDLLTEGAFTVSAIRREGRTVWVKVRAGVAGTLRLRDPFDGAEFAIGGAALQREGAVLAGPMAPGQEVVLCLPGETGELDAAGDIVHAGDTSRLGLR
jgi:alpha-L-fucosidase 2